MSGRSSSEWARPKPKSQRRQSSGTLMDVFDPLKSAFNRLNISAPSRPPEAPQRAATSLELPDPTALGRQSSSSGDGPSPPRSRPASVFSASSPPRFGLGKVRSDVGPRNVTRVESEFFALAQSILPAPSGYRAPNSSSLDRGVSALWETLRLLEKQADPTDEYPEWTEKLLKDSMIGYLQMQGPHIADMRFRLAQERKYPDRVYSWFQIVFSSLKTWLYELQVKLPYSLDIVVHVLLLFLQTLNATLPMTKDEDSAKIFIDHVENKFIKNLEITFKYIRITEDYALALDDDQIEQVFQASVRLATAIVKYFHGTTSQLNSQAQFDPNSLGSISSGMSGGRTSLNEILKGDTLAPVRGRILQYNEKLGFPRALGQGVLSRNNKRQDILEWLSPGSSWDRHNSFRSRRIKGIGQWFIESRSYQQWSNGMGPSVLGCHGMAGSGKTFITSLAIDKHVALTNTRNHVKIGVMHIYFNTSGEIHQKADKVIRSLLKQLVFQLDEIPDSIEDAYDLFLHDPREPERATFEDHLKNVIQSFNTVYLFLDGLDLINPHDRYVLCEAFKQIPRTRLKIFLTLTPGPTNKIDLSDKPGMRYLLQGARSLEIVSKEECIRTYLENQVNKKAKRCPPETKKAIIETISSQGPVQILLAKLQLVAVLSYFERGGNIYDILPRLPRAMDEAYLWITNEITADGPYVTELAKDVLSWIYYTNEIRTLHIEELQDLLATKRHARDVQPQDRPSVEQILAACHRLVICNKNTGIVRMTHRLIGVFLQKYKDAPNSFLHPIYVPALTCLNYLFLDVFGRGKCLTMEELRTRREHYKAAEYVCQYWGYYVRQSEENPQVQADTIALLASKPRRDAMNQINDYLRTNELRDSGRRSLHIIAENGLATICTIVMYNSYNTNNYNMYGPVANLAVLPEDDFRDGWNSKTVDKYEWTPLHMASFKGHPGVIQILLGARVNIEELSRKRETALHLAALAGQNEVVKMLLSAGANIEALNDQNRTPLHIAASGGYDDVVETLLQLRASHLAGDLDSRTPIHLAAACGQARIVEILIKYGANVEFRDREGRTPLHLAAHFGQERVVEVLLAAKANPNPEDIHKRTPLHLAALKNYQDIFKMLEDEMGSYPGRNAQGNQISMVV